MERSKSAWSRREFICSASGAGAAMMLKPMLSLGNRSDADSKVTAIVAKTIGIDTHNHIDVPLTTAELPGPKVDLAGEMKRSGLSAICMTFAVDYQRLTKEGEAYERFTNGLTAMDELLKSNGIKRSFNLTDIQAAHQNGKPTVIQSVEGAHFLEGKIDRLQVAYGKGLRHLGLLHDSDASVPLGDIYTNPPKWGGLTTFGADVIRECNKLGVLVDLTHCSNDTIDAALKTTKQPIVISHTGLDTQLGQNEMMARMMRPRLISKEQARKVADAGGVIGVWTHLADSPLAYAQNIRAMVEVAGIDHVCIGTDTKMTPSYRPAGSFGGPPPGNRGPQPGSDTGNRNNMPPPTGERQNRPGGGPDSPNQKRVGERTNEAWQNQTEGFYYTVVGALLQAGFTEAEIGKIGGGNYCRIFNTTTAGR